MNTVFKIVILLISASVFFAGPAVAGGGHTAEQMMEAGYDCFNDGPFNWTHCLDLDKFGNPAVPVKVFSVDGSKFLGTELLLREDIYAGQPCPQNDLNTWDYLGAEGPPYFACHHFNTSDASDD